jgi:hypothetical protein
MVRLRSPLPAVWAPACKLVLLLALLWQATGSSAMALMGCCLAPQPCCVAVIAASHCGVCAPAAVLQTTADPPAAAAAHAALAIDLQARRWVEPVDDIWRPPAAEHLNHRFNLAINP